jgi:hypothetical protein
LQPRSQQLAKLYAAEGRWEDAENVKHVVDAIRRAPAYSLIEVRAVSFGNILSTSTG